MKHNETCSNNTPPRNDAPPPRGGVISIKKFMTDASVEFGGNGIVVVEVTLVESMLKRRYRSTRAVVLRGKEVSPIARKAYILSQNLAK